MAFSLSRSSTLRRLLTPAGSKPLWFVSLTLVSRAISGTSSPTSSTAPCPRSVLVALCLHPGSTLALRKAEFFLSFFSTCLSTVSPPLFVQPFRCPPLVASDPFRHVCQLCADDLVILTASQTDVQVALDAMRAWGVRWRFSFSIGNTKSATVVFGPMRGCPDCCVHLGSLVQQYRYLGVVLSPTLSWRPHVDFICSRGDCLFHQASACCLGEGLPLSFSSSVFVTFVLSSSSFSLEFIGDDPPALQQFNLALRRWCRHLLGWPSASPVAAVYWKLGTGDAHRLAPWRAFPLFGRLSRC